MARMCLIFRDKTWIAMKDRSLFPSPSIPPVFHVIRHTLIFIVILGFVRVLLTDKFLPKSLFALV